MSNRSELLPDRRTSWSNSRARKLGTLDIAIKTDEACDIEFLGIESQILADLRRRDMLSGFEVKVLCCHRAITEPEAPQLVVRSEIIKPLFRPYAIDRFRSVENDMLAAGLT